MDTNPPRRRVARYALVVGACALLVVALDLITNTLNRTYYYWDFALYYDMAEHGLSGADLWAPFAYRFLTPLLAGAVADLLAVSTEIGFTVWAYVGAVAQLALVFVLAERFGAQGWRAAVAVAVVALSLYNVRFLLFDVSRPDHLAYPLMVVAVLALFDRRYALCVGASCLGLLAREFLIIPPIILEVVLLREALRGRRAAWRWMLVTFVIVSLFVIVPRALIPIQGSGQYVDPVNDASTLENLIRAPLSERRDFNIAFNLASYLLPLLLLITPGRARAAWAVLAPHRLFLALYTALVLLLTMYGGTDLWRFVSYLFIPQVIVLAVLLRRGVAGVEVIYMLAAVAAYNRLFSEIPNLLDPYLDFYGGYDNRVNASTLMRLFELGAYLFGAVLLRGLLRVAQYRARRAASVAAGQGARGAMGT